MEEFSMSLLADNAYSNTTNNNIINNNNMSNNNTNMHHHKDDMLAANTAACMYETQKSEMSKAKSGYSTFTTCAQKSDILDHHTDIDANLDAGVSLGALCDLKFSEAGGPIGATLVNETTQTSNYKVLPPLMAGTEANQIMTGLQKVNATTPRCINVPTFSNMLFTRDDIQQSSTTATSQQHYLALKGNEVKNTAESIQQHFITNTEIATTTTEMSPPNEFAGRGMNASGRSVEGNFRNNLLEYGIASSSSSASHNLNNYSESSTNHNGLDVNINNRATNENHISTTTVTTIAATTPTTNVTNQTANNTPNQSQHQQQQHATTSSTRTTLHSIEELAASSCTPTSSTTSSINTFVNNNNASSSTATSVPLNNINNANDVQQHDHSQDNMPNSSNNPQQQYVIHQQQLHQQQHHRQQFQHQQHLLNSSSISSDSNESISSSDELIDMELNESSGYRDTTSSHSQHITNGGRTGNNPSSNQQLSSNPSGDSLINTFSNNGGLSASSASGTYMSVLPPNVAATTSSSAPYLGGVINHFGGGTHSGPDVIDIKHLFEELCPVCGDKVSGYHYGLLTCESCKGFFKRTVQNKKVYTCVAERSCHIDKTQRKRCPYCRFRKCLEVGMKIEAVRADRMRGGRNKFGPMYKRDRARKLQAVRQRQIALQALRTSVGTGHMKATSLSTGYQQAYINRNIKQEIQIPQVSSLTKSPDSSPSAMTIALGQVNTSSGVIATPLQGSNGASGNSVNNNNSSNRSDGLNHVGGGSGNFHETGTGSLQSVSDSKLCTHPSSTANSIIEPLTVSPIIRDFVQSIDDREWQTQLFALLQKQTYNQVEVDLFELMCKVLDQNLFSQVDWARNTVFFKDLKVDDQMKLLQHSWSDMLILDHLHQHIHNGLPDETQLNNGQVFNLLSLGLLGVPQLSDYFNELQNKLQDLKFDMGDYVCMKFLILLNPDIRGIINKKAVILGQENVQAALLDYTLTCYPSVTDKFRRLLSILPEIHAMASRGEEHLYSKHCAGSAPTQTLLMEMLHAKRKV